MRISDGSAATLLFLVTTTASAQEVANDNGVGEEAPFAITGSVEIDNVLSQREQDWLETFTWSPVLRASAHVLPQLRVGATLPFAVGSYWREFSSDSEPVREEGVGGGLGNPYLEARGVIENGATTLEVGGGIAIPGAWVEDELDFNRSNADAYREAKDGRAGLSAWLFEPEVVSFVVPLRVTFRPAGGFVLQADLAMAASVSCGRDGLSSLFTQVEVSAAYTFGALELGARLSNATHLSVKRREDGYDTNYYAAITPYARGTFGNTFVQAAFIGNVFPSYNAFFVPWGTLSGQLLVGYNVN